MAGESERPDAELAGYAWPLEVAVEKYTCPNGCDLRGAEIPLKYRSNRSDTHYSEVVGIVDRDRDRVVEWFCPKCKIRWKRV